LTALKLLELEPEIILAQFFLDFLLVILAILLNLQYVWHLMLCYCEHIEFLQ